MERIRVREREALESKEDNYLSYMRRVKAFHERTRTGQVLVKYTERPWELCRVGRIKWFYNEGFYKTAAQNWRCFMHEMRSFSGSHKHQGGSLLYCFEGTGFTMYNGIKVKYQAGDLILLPLLQELLDHQHHNGVDGGPPMRWICFNYLPFYEHVGSDDNTGSYSPEWSGTAELEVLSQRPTGKTAFKGIRTWDRNDRDATVTELPGDLPEDATLLDRLYHLRDQQRFYHENADWVVRGEQLPWEWNRQGKMKWYLHPLFKERALRNHIFYMQEIPPGSRTGLQRKQGNELFLFVEGRGYSMVDGVRYDWQKYDMIGLPSRERGSIVQHFNADPDKPAVFVAERPYIEGLGVDAGAGYEQLDDCPEWTARA